MVFQSRLLDIFNSLNRLQMVPRVHIVSYLQRVCNPVRLVSTQFEIVEHSSHVQILGWASCNTPSTPTIHSSVIVEFVMNEVALGIQ